jgi:hypothetical protein
MIPFEQINAAALSQARRLLLEWFPNGKFQGDEFVVGNLQGDAGDSLSINVVTGQWADFAFKEAVKGGDMISVRAAQRHSGNRVKAALELADILGIDCDRQSDTKTESNGAKRDSIWRPMIPPPPGTPRPNGELHGFDAVHEYTGLDDRVTHYVGRKEARLGKGKSFTPITYGELDGKLGWHFKHPATPLPLYGLNRLATMPGATVLLCEGEKSADAAQSLFPDYACLAWARGWQSAKVADLTPLLNREVIIWPDADDPGRRAAAEIKAKLPHALVLATTGLDDGFDAANLDVDDPDAWLRDRIAPGQTESEAGKPKGADNKLFPLLSIADIEAIPDPTWLVPGLLITNTFAVLYGPPKSLKSFLALDIALCKATGLPWRGQEIEQGDVLYICAEGAPGLKRRIQAWKLKRKWSGDIPGFRAIPLAVNLLDEAQARRLVLTVEAAKSTGFHPKLVIADTLARCAQGGDENSARDMGIIVTNGALVQRELDCTFLPIHHTGKDEDKGMRGSSALLGAADTVLRVIRAGEQVTIQIEAQKDEEDGQEFVFQAEKVHLPTGNDGKPRTSLFMTADLSIPEPRKSAEPLTRDEQAWFRDLTDMFATPGLAKERTVILGGGATLGNMTLTREQVRDGYRSRGRFRDVTRDEAMSGADRELLRRRLNGLRDKGKIGMTDEFVWLL